MERVPIYIDIIDSPLNLTLVVAVGRLDGLPTRTHTVENINEDNIIALQRATANDIFTLLVQKGNTGIRNMMYSINVTNAQSQLGQDTLDWCLSPRR